MNAKKKLLDGKKLLVVDDEVDLREIISEDFEMMGAEVFSAENGRVAFEIAQRVLPDAIVSDIRMPGGDGIELLKSVRSEMPSPQPRVFLITGFADVTVDQAKEMGAQGMLPKPFNLRQLREMVVRSLDGDSQDTVEG